MLRDENEYAHILAGKYTEIPAPIAADKQRDGRRRDDHNCNPGENGNQHVSTQILVSIECKRIQAIYGFLWTMRMTNRIRKTRVHMIPASPSKIADSVWLIFLNQR